MPLVLRVVRAVPARTSSRASRRPARALLPVRGVLPCVVPALLLTEPLSLATRLGATLLVLGLSLWLFTKRGPGTKGNRDKPHA